MSTAWRNHRARGHDRHGAARAARRRALARFIATKGSVALDGMSLTVKRSRATTFSVLIIPHTLAVTTSAPGGGERSTSRSTDGALRGAADGTELTATAACRSRARRGLHTVLAELANNRDIALTMARRWPTWQTPRALKDQNDLAGARILVVEARFYDDIADALLKGASRALKQAGASLDSVTVPGALEIPAAIAIALERPRRREAL